MTFIIVITLLPQLCFCNIVTTFHKVVTKVSICEWVGWNAVNNYASCNSLPIEVNIMTSSKARVPMLQLIYVTLPVTLVYIYGTWIMGCNVHIG